MSDSVFCHPWRTAFDEDPDTHLTLPLYHLLGQKITIESSNIQKPSHLLVSAWKNLETPKKGEVRACDGVIHISPLEKYDELFLIEDWVIGEKPEGYPGVFGRTTHPDLVSVSLYYERSNEKWDFKIHLRHPGEITEEKLKKMREEVLGRTSMAACRYSFLDRVHE